MSNEEFIAKAKKLVRDYAIEHLDRSDSIPEFDVYVVWNAYILGNNKAMLSTSLIDGMYYEVTYSKERVEMYFDAYKKFENRKVGFEE